jgi:hypothetical protein
MFEMCSSNVWSLWEIMAIHVQHKSVLCLAMTQQETGR